jgi:RNA polymerase sigma-70 factor (ECF subfamily)
LQKAASQKTEKFEKEALIHLDVIFAAALRMTGSRMEAEDLAQETFLRAFRFFDKFKSGTNCRAWLFKIMTNLYINRYNSQKSRPQGINFDSVEDHYPQTRSAVDEYINNPHYDSDLVFAELLDDDIRSLLLELPRDFRLTVILCDIQGFSYEETARFTGVKIGTVKSRLFRARRKLQKGLYEWARANGYYPKGILHGAA